MNRTSVVLFAALLAAPSATSALAQQPVSDARVAELAALARVQLGAQEATAPAGPVMELKIEDAVRRALEQNLELKIERLNPQSFDIALQQIRATYAPTVNSAFGQRSTTRTPTSQLNGGQRVVNDTLTYNGGISQNVRWFGGSASVNFQNNRASSNDSYSLFNPQYNSTLTLNYTQPLLRNFKIDSPRQQWLTTQISRELADVQLRALVINTEANVRNAYWDLLYAVQAVDVARSALQLADKLVEDNRMKVEIGTLAPIDVVQAESEAANRRQSLAAAEATLRNAELALKRYVVGGTDDPIWSMTLNPVDRPEFKPEPVNIEAAIRVALGDRADLTQSRRTLESSEINVRFLDNQRLPQLDLTASYGVQGLGGTRYKREGLGGAISQTFPGGYKDAVSTLFKNDYPTWNLQLNFTYPIGNSQADAQVASARLKMTQAQAQLRALELTVATDVTSSGLAIQSAAKRLEAAKVASALAQQKLDAEQSKFTVGMSTNFLVVQAQRDLRDAQIAELRALLDYRKAVVDFERVQHAAKR